MSRYLIAAGVAAALLFWNSKKPPDIERTAMIDAAMTMLDECPAADRMDSRSAKEAETFQQRWRTEYDPARYSIALANARKAHRDDIVVRGRDAWCSGQNGQMVSLGLSFRGD